jgi:flavodoxin
MSVDMPVKALIVLHSYHHLNTAKVANAIAGILGAQIVAPQEVNPEVLDDYDIVGFGSGIDSGKHYKELLDIADRLPRTSGKKSFIFSTSGIFSADKMKEDHSFLRNQLQSRGYSIVGEFSCRGFNTNSFLKFFGGMNKGRPNDEDLGRACEFAERLKNKMAE